MPPQAERPHAEAGPGQKAPEERPGIEDQAREHHEAFDDDREGQEMRRDTPFKKELDERTPRREMETGDEQPSETQDSERRDRTEISSEGAQGAQGEERRDREEAGGEAAYAHQPGQMTTRVMSEEEESQLRTRERELESIGIEEAQGSRIDELSWLERSKKEREAGNPKDRGRGRGSMSLEEAGHRGGEMVKKKYGHQFYSDIGRKGGQAAQARRTPQERSDIGRKGGQSRGRRRSAGGRDSAPSKEP